MRVAEIAQAKYGDILQFRPTSAKGELIRWADATIGGWRDNGLGSMSPYSHTAVYDRYEDGQHWMFESDGEGVRHSVILEELGNFDIFRTNTPMPIRSREELAALCNRRKYDFLGLLKILSYYVTGREHDWQDLRRMWCTEFANWAYFGRIVEDGPSTPRTFSVAPSLV